MPKKIENSLKKLARKKNLTGKSFDRYVYGTLQKTTSWKPGRRKKKTARPGD